MEDPPTFNLCQFNESENIIGCWYCHCGIPDFSVLERPIFELKSFYTYDQHRTWLHQYSPIVTLSEQHDVISKKRAKIILVIKIY